VGRDWARFRAIFYLRVRESIAEALKTLKGELYDSSGNLEFSRTFSK